MSTLNQAINSTRQLVAKEVDRIFKIVFPDTGKGSLWKGKKIISTEKWQVLKKKRDFQYELLECVPEDYVEHPFCYTKDENLQTMRSEWYKDYYEFLENKKSAAFGESKCRGCILHPFDSYLNESLRKVILKGVDKKYEFPCPVVNMFKCPHGQDKQDSDKILFTLRDLWKVISDVLRSAHSKFVASYGDVSVESTTIPMKGIIDIFHTITNRKQFDMVFEQYIKDVEKTEQRHKESDVLFESEFLWKWKKSIIDYFMGLKTKIKIDELLNFEGKNLEQEKEDEKRRQNIH
jgi:hypothetical protein